MNLFSFYQVYVKLNGISVECLADIKPGSRPSKLMANMLKEKLSNIHLKNKRTTDLATSADSKLPISASTCHSLEDDASKSKVSIVTKNSPKQSTCLKDGDFIDLTLDDSSDEDEFPVNKIRTVNNNCNVQVANLGENPGAINQVSSKKEHLAKLRLTSSKENHQPSMEPAFTKERPTEKLNDSVHGSKGNESERMNIDSSDSPLSKTSNTNKELEHAVVLPAVETNEAIKSALRTTTTVESNICNVGVKSTPHTTASVELNNCNIGVKSTPHTTVGVKSTPHTTVGVKSTPHTTTSVELNNCNIGVKSTPHTTASVELNNFNIGVKAAPLTIVESNDCNIVVKSTLHTTASVESNHCNVAAVPEKCSFDVTVGADSKLDEHATDAQLTKCNSDVQKGHHGTGIEMAHNGSTSTNKKTCNIEGGFSAEKRENPDKKLDKCGVDINLAGSPAQIILNTLINPCKPDSFTSKHHKTETQVNLEKNAADMHLESKLETKVDLGQNANSEAKPELEVPNTASNSSSSLTLVDCKPLSQLKFIKRNKNVRRSTSRLPSMTGANNLNTYDAEDLVVCPFCPKRLLFRLLPAHVQFHGSDCEHKCKECNFATSFK